MIDLSKTKDFDWDHGNKEKNRTKHGVTPRECEEVFINTPIFIIEDLVHSQTEQRLQVRGKTNAGRLLSLVYTMRNQRIRIISARDQSKREREFYEKAQTNT